MKNQIAFSSILPKLGTLRFVRNAPSRSCGCDTVRNQFIIEYENGEVFQSYDSICGVKYDGSLYLSDYHDYSRTTSKYVGDWCHRSTKERRDGLENGTIKGLVLNED